MFEQEFFFFLVFWATKWLQTFFCLNAVSRVSRNRLKNHWKYFWCHISQRLDRKKSRNWEETLHKHLLLIPSVVATCRPERTSRALKEVSAGFNKAELDLLIYWARHEFKYKVMDDKRLLKGSWAGTIGWHDTNPVQNKPWRSSSVNTLLKVQPPGM